MQGGSPAASGGDGRQGRATWRLPPRARFLVIAGVLVAAASVFVAVFWVHGVWVPVCRGAGGRRCDAFRRDQRLVARALVLGVGLAWAAGLGGLALLSSRASKVSRDRGRVRPRAPSDTGADRRSAAAGARAG